jgi:3-oxoacyl-[acyl-carrier protein] reductase
VGGACGFLAADDAQYTTDARLVLDGGVLIPQRSPQVETLRVELFPAIA